MSKKILFLFLILINFIHTENIFGQNNFTTPVLKTILGISSSYTNNEGGTTTFNGTSNQILYSVSNSGTTFRKAPVTSPLYKIKRNNVSAQYTGATFYAEGTRITNGYNLVTSQPAGNTGDDVMISVFDKGYINGGEDNMFNNNTGNATYNNVERLDYVFPNGVTIVDNTKQGFIVCERNKNDYFYVAIAAGKDGSNNISSYYSTLVNIDPSNTEWSTVKPNMLSYPFKYDPTDVSFQYPIGTTPGMGTQTMYGILYKFADFGISNGQTVYGISIAAGDAPTTASSWLNISNFPTNTTGANGGMDFNGITGLYNEAVTISGTIYHDANGLTDATINGTGINTVDGTPIYAYLIDPNGNVYDKQQPASNGTYSFNVAGNVSLSVMISTENIQITQPAPKSSFASGSLWTNTGEQYGNNNNAGTGIESGTPNGTIALSTTFSTNTTNINFGIEKKGVVNDVSKSAVNPGGTVKITAPTLAGNDDEDGTLGSTSDFKIVSLPSASLGVLYYNNIAVTTGQIITNYNPSLLQIDPANGNVSVSFTYSYVDHAGVESEKATATINFGTLTVSGHIYDDADGGTITTTTPLSSVSSQQLYVYLVNAAGNIVSKSTVNGGAFSFTNANANTAYTVRLSTSNANVGAVAPAQNLPTDWVNVGESVGGTLDGTIDGSIALSTTTSDINSVLFALDQRPTSDDVFSSALNPGGSSQVQAPSLTGSDPEDGIMNSGEDFKIISLPANGILYYNGTTVSLNQVISNYNPTLLKIDPNSTGADIITFTYAGVDQANKADLTPATATLQVYTYTISGHVYDDADGGTISTTTPMNTIGGQQLYAYLVNSSGNIVEKQLVKSDGSYILYSGIPSTNYTVRISSTSANIGQSAPSTVLPSPWANTDETYGTNNSAGSGSDVTDNFQISVTRSSGNVTGVDFAAEQLPESYGVFGSARNPANDGTGTTSTGKVKIPPLEGYDPEDGVKGSGNTLKIITLPAANTGTLYYRIGGNYTPVTAGQIITNYKTNRLRVDPYGTNKVDLNISFTYAWIDDANFEDPTPATAELSVWGIQVRIYGTIYDDANGGTPDGTTISSINGAQLYAYLVNTSNIVEEKVLIATDGTYVLYSADKNVDYTVKISTTQVAVGASAPSTALPSGWVNTDELFGTNNVNGTGSDPVDDFSVSVKKSSNGKIEFVDFGVDQTPSSDNKSYSGLNPGGSNYVSCPALTGADPEEGAFSYNSGRSIKITSISNGNLSYNGTSLSAGSIVSYANASLLRMDPTFEGAGTSSFNYSWIDGASKEGLTPAKVTFNFSSLTIEGKIYDDGDGASNGIGGSFIGSLSGTQLYAYLNVGTGVVLDKATIGSNGLFTFSNASSGTNYKVTVSTSNVAIGSATPTSSNLPTNWVSVGEDPGSGTLDGNANGIVNVTTGTSSINGVKIGFNKRPETNNASSTNANPGGTSSVQVPNLSGTDLEFGTLGSSNSFKIISLPLSSSGKLYYNGVLVTAGQIISNYTPSLLSLDPVDGYVVATFTVAAIDKAGDEDLSPATITMTFTSKVISGTVYDDPNGSTPNGTGIGTLTSSTLYAYLISGTTVLEKQNVDANGTYSFTSGIANTSYLVKISTTSVNVGNTAPSSANLPNGWFATGDYYGTNNSAGSGNESGTADLSIAVHTGNFDVSNVNFGVNEKPTAHYKQYIAQDMQGFPVQSGNSTYPNVIPLKDASGTSDGNITTNALPGKVSGYDRESGKYAGATGTTSNLKIAFNSLPTNALLSYYNGSSYIELVANPSASDPSYTYWSTSNSRYEINDFNPNNLYVYFDPYDPNSIEFQYSWIDAAGAESTSNYYIIDFDADSNPLPIELASLEAYYTGDHNAKIKWTTASELNTKKFIVEKSIDLIHFESIGEIAAAGNSNTLKNYSFIDFNCINEMSYYRIKAIDFDGSVSISQVVAVNANHKNNIQVTPNPATQFININFESTAQNKIGDVIIKDALGKVVYSKKMDFKSNRQINIEFLENGIYFIQIKYGNLVETFKLIKN